jgi:hypothetical protein
MSNHDNIQKKPKMIPFLGIAVQIYLTYIFCNGFYTILGEKVKLFGVFEMLTRSFENTSVFSAELFNSYARVVLCILYIVNVFRMIKIVVASIKSAKLLKQAFNTATGDAIFVRTLLGDVIGGVRHILYLSLSFLCYSRLLSIYAMGIGSCVGLLVVFMICMIIEAFYLSYIQGKRFWFSFAKSICGYLFAIMAVAFIFNLGEKTLFDFVYAIYSKLHAVHLNTFMDWLYYICLDCLVYLVPLLYALGLVRLFKLMFKKTKHASNSARIMQNINLYLISVPLFIILICVCLRIRSGVNEFNYYWSVITSYSSIIIGAVLAKLLICVANRRVKYNRFIELPISEKRTLD